MFTDSTLNLRYNNTDKQHRQDMTTMSRAGAQICGLQEAQTPEVIASIKKWLYNHPNWAVVWGGECPVLYRKNMFEVKDHHLIHVHEGKAGVNPERVINHVIFNMAGTTLHYFNHHAEQQFTERYSDTANYDYRVKVARLCFDAAVHHTAGKTGIVRFGGDLNVDLNNKERGWYPYRMRDNFQFDTNAGLDHIGYRIGEGVSLHKPRSIAIHSDHRLRLVDVKIKGV